MAATKNSRLTRESRKGAFGLLANGASGPWEIAIDEALSGPDRWYAQIEGPSVVFSFELPSLDVVAKMIQFLQAPPPPTGKQTSQSTEENRSMVVGKDR